MLYGWQMAHEQVDFAFNRMPVILLPYVVTVLSFTYIV